MKVLWFSDSVPNYIEQSNKKGSTHPYFGTGWVSSLENELTKNPNIELAVSFFHESDDVKVFQGKTLYYPVFKPKGSYLKRLIRNWRPQLKSTFFLNRLKDVINDFKPDVIQVFGTESFFIDVVKITDVPVVIHIQCLTPVWLNAWYPSGFSKLDTLLYEKSIFNVIKGHSDIFHYKRFKKQVQREVEAYPFIKHLMGRTEWDKSCSGFLMPNARYYPINEILRSCFYSATQWKPHQKRPMIKLISTISPSSYKGLDLILKTASILSTYLKLNFEWTVCGIAENNSHVHIVEKKIGLKFKSNNVFFAGALDPNSLIINLTDSDIYIHPSYIETSSISLSEAQMLGMPVICCYIGGLTTLVENNKTGILVAANDPYYLASKISYLSFDKNAAILLGNNARKIAMARHDSTEIVSNVIHTYKEIMSLNKAKE